MVPAVLAALAILSIWPLTLAWNPQNPDLHIWIFLIGLTEFAVVVTALIVSVSIIEEWEVTVLYVLATFFMFVFTPGALILLPFTIFIFQFASPILLLALVMTVVGRTLIGAGRAISGTGLMLVPVLLVAGVAFYRPAAQGSPVWPVLGAVHLVLAGALIAAAYVQVHRSQSPDRSRA